MGEPAYTATLHPLGSGLWLFGCKEALAPPRSRSQAPRAMRKQTWAVLSALHAVNACAVG